MEAGNAAPALQVIVLVSSCELHSFPLSSLRLSFSFRFCNQLSHPPPSLCSIPAILSRRLVPPVAIPRTKRLFPGLQPTTSLGAAANNPPPKKIQLFNHVSPKQSRTPHSNKARAACRGFWSMASANSKANQVTSRMHLGSGRGIPSLVSFVRQARG